MFLSYVLEEPLVGDYSAILVHDEHAEASSAWAVLMSYSPGGDRSRHRLARIYPDEELGRPAWAESGESGVVALAEWEDEKSARWKHMAFVADFHENISQAAARLRMTLPDASRAESEIESTD